MSEDNKKVSNYFDTLDLSEKVVDQLNKAAPTPDAKKSLVDYLKYVKIAAAVAIIRSKPEGFTGKQYAEHLCGQYQRAQLCWKDQVGQLQRKILGLQQTIVQKDIELLKPGNKKDATLSQGANKQFAQTRSAVDDEEQSQDLFPTPPSSSEERQPVTYTAEPTSTSTGKSLDQHVTFLSSVMLLKDIDLRTSTSFGDEVESVLKDSVESALVNLEHVICSSDGHSLSPAIIQHAVDTIVDVVCSKRLGNHAQLIEKLVLQFCRAVIVSILQWKPVVESDHQERLCHVLIRLAKCPKLHPDILLLLCECVTNCAAALRQVQNGEASLNPHAFESIYYVFWTMERILELKDGTIRSTLTDLHLKSISELLEQSLLHISITFPAFAYSVWKIGSLVHNIQQRNLFRARTDNKQLCAPK